MISFTKKRLKVSLYARSSTCIWRVFIVHGSANELVLRELSKRKKIRSQMFSLKPNSNKKFFILRVNEDFQSNFVGNVT